MAYALVDQMKVEGSTLRGGVIQGLVMRSNVMMTMPFEDIGTINQTVARWKTLPSVAFRKINAAYSEGAGTYEQLNETIYPLGKDIDVDKIFVRDRKVIIDPRATQANMALKSIAYTFNDYFLNGDQASDPDGFTGIKKRIANLPAAQTVSPDAATYPNGITPKTNSTTQNDFLDLLDNLIYALDEGQADVLYMNSRALLGISSVLRRLGLLATTQDMFGRRIMRYGEGGPLLADIGVKTDQTTQIITNTETYGGSSVTTSIYAVRYGVGEYLHGIQEYDLEVYDLNELQTAPQFRTRLDWPVGIALWNERAIARLPGLIF